ncbi:MAG: alpha/beta hydrolase [Pseudomonadota bacterium]
MRFELNGAEIYASTGGRPHKEGRPHLIFLHGSGQSHVSFSQQVRVFAYDGFNVLAPDFPGHGLSGGEPLSTIGDMADWVKSAMDHLGIENAHIAGHSQGALVALEFGRRYPDQIESLIVLASGAAIPVNDYLLNKAATDQSKAINAMMAWGSGNLGHKFDNTVPGASHIGAGTQLMMNNPEGALSADLQACNAYSEGLDAAAGIACPSLCVLAEKDKMTPLKAGLKLAGALKDSETVTIKGAGHMLPPENPREVNEALRGFLGRVA